MNVHQEEPLAANQFEAYMNYMEARYTLALHAAQLSAYEEVLELLNNTPVGGEEKVRAIVIERIADLSAGKMR